VQRPEQQVAVAAKVVECHRGSLPVGMDTLAPLVAKAARLVVNGPSTGP
jgi:hypothetical protein